MNDCKNKRICIVPGTFDPVTNGHLDMIMRAAKLFDKIYVTAFANSVKKNMFSPEDRYEMLRLACEDYSGGAEITVDVTSELLADYAKSKNANFIVKGVRNMMDYDYEYQLFLINREIGKNIISESETKVEIETIFFPSKNEHLYISSSFVREMITYNKDISLYVPAKVCEFIKCKHKQKIASGGKGNFL